MSTVPADIPVTLPVLFTIAIPASSVLQVPPGIVAFNDVTECIHTTLLPDKIDVSGNIFIVTGAYAETMPQIPATEY